VAFEHHGHVYKRTKPIYNGVVSYSFADFFVSNIFLPFSFHQVDEKKGVLYIGDGGFGADLVSVSSETLESDWIAVAESLW
jgi:hypothetical protein